MRVVETHSSAPISVEKTVRGEEIRALTSGKAGVVLPLSYVPLLREDRVSRGSLQVSLRMAETLFPLMNAVNVTVYAHLVPFLAFERFDGMDQFNRSYQGEKEPRGAAEAIPFFQTVNFNRDHAFWKTLGVQWPNGSAINSAPFEAFKVLVDHRRKVRSQHLPEYTSGPAALPRAFWKNPNMYHIVPDFDQAAMDGEVFLDLATQQLPVVFPETSPTLKKEGGGAFGSATARLEKGTGAQGHKLQVYDGVNAYFDFGEVFAELASGGVSLSLSNIDAAKKTAAFAKLRAQYAGIDDDYLIDLLMQGIRVPPESLNQPILLDKQSTVFGYTERHAMDGDNLDKSATTGQTALTLNFRTPPLNTGGIILITAEIVPEQLFERQHDYFLGTTAPSALPDFTRDYLDPEKVDVVPNKHVDVLHSQPDGTFGYAPLNHMWKRSLTRIGGRYYRPASAGFVEDRQRFWSIESVDPTLTSDFYLCPATMPHSVFMDTAADPFEVLTVGSVQIVGNTVFGKVLEEDRGDFEAVNAKVDLTRINQNEE